jgi:chromate transporter
VESEKKNYKLLFEIFLTFFKISPITFGGGFAMIPVLEMEMVEKKKWIEREKIVDVFVVSQSVPGAIAVNSATFLGYQIAGIPGALAAVLGMVVPTFLIIIILGILLVSFQHNLYVQAALKGIRPIIVALIAAAAIKMGKVTLTDKVCWVIMILCITVLLIFKSLNIIFVILAGAVLGIVIITIHDKLSILRKNKSAEN